MTVDKIRRHDFLRWTYTDFFLFHALVNCNHIIMAMISFGIMLILSGSMPWSQSLSFVTTVTMVTHSFYCNIIIMYLVLFHLYHREISCSYDVLSLVSIIRAFLYSVGPADESSHYKNEGRKTVWLSDSFLVTSLEYYMHPKLQHISFFSLCSFSDVATRFTFF